MAEATRKSRGSRTTTPTAAKKTSATGRKAASTTTQRVGSTVQRVGSTTQRAGSTASAAPKKTVAKKTNGRAVVAKPAPGITVKSAPEITLKMPVPARKPAVTKSKNGSSQFSDPDVRQAEIARRAYLLAERRGFATGHETEDWLAAEASLDR